MTLNFKELLNNYQVEIPIIQRDYVQGRTTKKIEKIRNNFLDSIEKVFGGDLLHLDFVYGFKNERFTPLDGQQRLTTLFLLYWYFNNKEGSSNVIQLKNFTYETHKNVKEFIQFLLKIENTDFNQKTISGELTDNNKFKKIWDQEPSVKSMLIMLDAIHDKFNKYTTGLNYLDNITFSLLDMKKNDLSDDLYIKMNSRGKELTDFDNFKVQFEKTLENYEDLQKEFEEKIDGIWIDLFWQYRDDDEYTIDNQFMRFFWVITEILYFKFIGTKEDYNIFVDTWEDSTPSVDYDIIREVYSNQESIKILFQILDKATELGKEKITQVFNCIFCEEDEFEKYMTHLSIFDADVDLFKDICNSGTMPQKWLLLLYAVLHSKFDIDIDKIRIIRNLVLSDHMRPRDFKSQIATIESIIKDGEIPENPGFLKALVDEEKKKQEILKKDPILKKSIWELENNRYLKSNIQIFNEYLEVEELQKLQKLGQVFSYYFNPSDGINDLFRRAVLTQGDYSVYDGGGSTHMEYWEERWHLCATFGEWQELFATFGTKNLSPERAGERRKWILQLFELIQDTVDKNQADNLLQNIIDTYNNKENVCYTMIKNPEVLKYSLNKRFMWHDNEEKITNILKKKTYQNKNYKAYSSF